MNLVTANNDKSYNNALRELQSQLQKLITTWDRIIKSQEEVSGKLGLLILANNAMIDSIQKKLRVIEKLENAL